MKSPQVLGACVLCALAGCGHTHPGATAAQAGTSALVSSSGMPSPQAPASAATAAAGDAAVTPTGAGGHAAAGAMPRADTFAAFLVPLTTDDVQLYLAVMQAAAERKRHPTAGDLSALQMEKTHDAAQDAVNRYNAPIVAAHEAKVQAAMAAFQAAQARGDQAAASAALLEVGTLDIKTMPDLDPAVARHAMLLDTGTYDILIVEERHLDEDRYSRVRENIEEIYSPDPGIATCGGVCGTPHWTAEQIRNRKLLASAEARNRKMLAPYAVSIRAAQGALHSVPATNRQP